MLFGAVRQASFMENATFHIPKLETPKISLSVQLEYTFSELSCVPLFEGRRNLLGFFFYAPCPFLPKHYKDSNQPFFYRMTVLFWPLNLISHASSISKLVFRVGWPRAKPLMSGEMSGHLFRLAGLETDIICTDTIHSFGWILNSYKEGWKSSEVGLAWWCWWNRIWV